MPDLKFWKVFICHRRSGGAVGIIFLFCFLFLVPNNSIADRSIRSTNSTIEAGFNFLYRQMDKFHRAVVVSGEPGYQAYFPSGKMGDVEALSIETESCDRPRPGKDTCLRIDYNPGSGPWSALFFLYPENNWGDRPGRNLTGATRLSFWARSDPAMNVSFSAGGVNKDKHAGRFSDSFGPLYLNHVSLGKQWKNFTFELSNKDLSSVIGAFALSVNILEGGRKGSIFLDDIEFNTSFLNEPRFLQSYRPQGCILKDPANPKAIDAPIDACHVYDQALTLLAFLARGTSEDLLRAKLIGEALVKAQNNDRYYGDGRLRNSYASGPLIDPITKSTRLPGQWDDQTQMFLEDEYAAGSDTGNATWAALALVQAHYFLPPRQGDIFLNAARKIGRWVIKNNKVEDAFGGFQGGFEDFEPTKDHPKGQSRSTWRSTEHNIDLVSLFGHLASAVGKHSAEGRMWSRQQAHARKFVQKMWQEAPGGAYLYTGTEPDTSTINKSVIALDTQTWAVLGLGEPMRYSKTLDWALQHCGAMDIDNAFDFNCNDGDGAWWEGSAQMATALGVLGRNSEAVPIIEQLKKAQIESGPAAGAIPAASRCGLTTGFKHFWHSIQMDLPWLYPNAPHVGATAWFLFAAMGKNPYYLIPE
jgi:hypothetical protein